MCIKDRRCRVTILKSTVILRPLYEQTGAVGRFARRARWSARSFSASSSTSRSIGRRYGRILRAFLDDPQAFQGTQISEGTMDRHPRALRTSVAEDYILAA